MPEQAPQRMLYLLAPSLPEVESLLSAILRQVRTWGLASDERAEGDLHLALEEALTNAVLHGTLRIEPEFRERGISHLLAEVEARAARAPYVDLRVEILLDRLPGAVRITIKDSGPGFDVSRIPANPGPDAASGRGVMLIRSCMDEVQYNSSGNQITMLKRFAPALPGGSIQSAPRLESAPETDDIHPSQRQPSKG